MVFGDMKKAAAEATAAIEALTALNDRLEGLVERLEAAMPVPKSSRASKG